MINVKKIVSMLLFSALCALCDEEQSAYYYESWRYEPAPYEHSYYAPITLTAPYRYDSILDFDPARPYLGLSYVYSYGSFGSLRYPFYNSWWHGYSVYMNIFPAKYLTPVNDSESPPIPGSAPLVLKANEPSSPLELMLESFLNATNQTDRLGEELNLPGR